MMITDLDNLIRSTHIKQKQAFANRADEILPAGAAERGFHIYGKLKTRIAFAAAENDAEAIRYLRILHALAGVTFACARTAGDVSVLELQGEVVHLFMPGATVESNLDRVIEFSRLLINAVYDQVCPLAEKDVFGFSMATDHGPTVFVANRSPSSDSIVSLAPAANIPAKRLFAGVSAGHLALPNRFLGRSDSGWYERNLRTSDSLETVAREGGVSDARIFSEDLQAMIENAMSEVSGIRRGNREFLTQQAERVWDTPTVFRGVFFRADLHGFSKRIQGAWEAGNQAVRKEIDFFQALMNDTTSFLSRSRYFTLQLPWAGDCSNVLIKSMSESYEDSRESLPAVFASEWHGEMTDHEKGRQWLLSAAGGGYGNGTDGGNDGAVVISPLTLDNRRFIMTGGWSVRESLVAQDVTGLRVGDTVIPNSDYHALDYDIQNAFRNIHEDFWKASEAALSRLPITVHKALRYERAAPVSVAGVTLPKPRPYYETGYLA